MFASWQNNDFFITIEIYHIPYLSRDTRKPVFGFPTRSDTNGPVQQKKMAGSLKFRISEEEKLLCPCIVELLNEKILQLMIQA